MKAMKLIATVLVALLIVVIVAAPIGPLPGLFIGGTLTQAPTEWPDTSAVDEIKLKVGSGLPRVVIIWVIEHAGELHVVGAKDSGWVQTIGAGAPVEMRLGDNTYALTATPVEDGWQDVLQAYVDKYRDDYPDIVAGFPSPEEARGTVSVFRLMR